MVKQLALFSLSLSLYGPLQAQQALDFFSLSLEELMHIEITGATLTSQDINTAPSAVTVFNHQQIKRLGLSTLDELVNIVPGFQSYRSGQSPSRSPITARGRRIGGPTPELLMILDGHRLDEPRSHGVTNIIPKFSLSKVERIEFIRGPGSAIYGSNAMMAVINIITRKGVNEFNISLGSNNLAQADLLTSNSFQGIDFDFYSHVEKDDGESYQVKDAFTNSLTTTDDPQQWLDLNLRVKWKKTSMNLIYFQHESENFYELGNLSNDFNEHHGEFSSVSFKQEFNWPNFNSFIWLGHSEAGVEFKAQLTPAGAFSTISTPASSEPLLVDVDFSGVQEVRALWHNDWKINSNSSLQLGFERREIDVPQVTAGNNFDVGELVANSFPIQYYGELKQTTVIQAHTDRIILSAYSQYQHEIITNTHLTLGARYDDFSGVDSQFSPRLALVQEINKHHTVKALYGESFRAPSEGELGLTNNPVIIGNPDLKPETVKTFDLIWVGDWSDTMVTLGYFQNEFKDSIVQVSTDNNSRFTTNQDEDPSKGVEFEITHQPTDNWLLRSSYSDVLEDSGSSEKEAKEMASFMINFSQYKWNANLLAIRHGDRTTPAEVQDDPAIKLDSYWVVFSKIEYRYQQGLNFNLQAKNLFDEEYATPSRSGSAINGVPNRGREVSVGLNWLF